MSYRGTAMGYQKTKIQRYMVAEHSVATYQVNQQLLDTVGTFVKLVSVECLHWMRFSPCAQSCLNVHNYTVIKATIVWRDLSTL